MSKGAAKTGDGPTFMIAAEQFLPKDQRVLDDDFAMRILSPGMRAFASLMRFPPIYHWMVNASEKDIPGIWGGILIRKRYIDGKLRDSSSEISAVVNLGAGFDTRFFRLPELGNTPVWELDQPVNISAKRSQIIKALSELPDNLHLVPIDFDKESIASVLRENGYIKDVKTFFIWEAVTQYLTQAGIKSTFNFLSNAQSGSRLAFTYVLRDFIMGKSMYGWEKAYKKYILQDKIWLYGIDPGELPAILEKYGWRLIEDKDASELAESYVKSTGRTLLTTPVERMALAEKL